MFCFFSDTTNITNSKLFQSLVLYHQLQIITIISKYVALLGAHMTKVQYMCESELPSLWYTIYDNSEPGYFTKNQSFSKFTSMYCT